VKKGVSLIAVLVALCLLATGIATLFRVLPVLNTLSRRSNVYSACSQIADRLFKEIEEEFGSCLGPPVPDYLEGRDSLHPDYFYRLWFQEIKDGLYQVELEISWLTGGKTDKKSFYYTFRRR